MKPVKKAAKPAAEVPAKGTSGSKTLVKRLESLNKWREAYNPLVALTAPRVVQLGRDYFLGILADLQWTYFYIEQTDPDLFALIDRRSSRLLEMDYAIKMPKDAEKDPDKKNLAAEQAACLEEKFGQIDNLYEVIEHMALADFRGYSHCEKWYTGSELTHLEIVDQWNVVRDGLRGQWKYNPDARTALFNTLPDDMLIDPANFLIREVRRPINRIALFKYFWATMTEVDWNMFQRVYGVPGGVVTGPPNVPTDKVAEYEAAAQIIAEGGSGFLPHGSTWTANNGPRGTSPFLERLNYLSEKLVLVGTGGMLTMLAKSGSGTLAGNAHSDSFEQIAKGAARKISELFNKQLSKAWLEEDFPGQKQLAYYALSANEETKIGEVVDHVVKLSAAGFQANAAEISERTGYTLTLAPKPAAPGTPGGGGLDGKGSDPNTGDPASIDNRRLRNRRVKAGIDELFKANAAQRFTAAQAAALLPIANRLREIADIEDGQAQLAALGKFRAELPTLEKAVLAKSPDLAECLAEVIGTALVAGFTSAASAKTRPATP